MGPLNSLPISFSRSRENTVRIIFSLKALRYTSVSFKTINHSRQEVI